jgi:hypothetical protein
MNDRIKKWHDPNAKGKIFGIGLTKTGTMSLAMALKILGYDAKHYPWSLEEIDKKEATTDIPVACRFKELDLMYPNSKFILTTREFTDWITTTSRKPPDDHKPKLWRIETRARTYGALHFDKDKWSAAYIRHHEDVYSHFKFRDDLLVLHLEETDKWTRLCEFLGKPIPDKPYPKINRSVNKERKIY